MVHNSVKEVDGHTLSIETGKMAKQANGAAVLRCGKMVLLATATMSKKPKENCDFLPLTVEYSEKMYAAGKIPGGFFKREGRPSLNATLTSRLIDRPIRPSFPKNFHYELQVVVTVLSCDEKFAPEYYAITAASAALSVSNIPFNGPIAGVTVGYINNDYVINPSYEQLEESQLELVVAGTKDAILMVEAEAKEVSEAIVVEAIQRAHAAIQNQIAMQDELAQKVGVVKFESPAAEKHPELESQIAAFLGTQFRDNFRSGKKQEISNFLENLEKTVTEKFKQETPEGNNAAAVSAIYSKIKKDEIKKIIISEKIRPDGRKPNEIRPISIEVGLLPGAHGSALFTRGETQSLGVTTLGTALDEQLIESFQDTYKSNYYFHYNFPPFSVGEVGRMSGPGRREHGHGSLAERALKWALPNHEDFPYTIRIVSEILESNGSSSMASVCSGTLSLMDAGVPIKAPVSGIAMGLFMDDTGYAVLSDIQGLEDHYGDMDFKVAGTQNGITALQLDIKIAGLSKKILQEALDQAKEGRLHILQKMVEVMDKPRTELAEHAPKIEFLTINPEKVGLLIGPGGKTIKQIEESCKAVVVVTVPDKGTVAVSAKNTENLNKAKSRIIALTKDIQVGEVYEGRVVKITTFGAFIELVPGREGLLHISRISDRRINRVEDELDMHQSIWVKVINIDEQNRIGLDREKAPPVPA